MKYLFDNVSVECSRLATAAYSTSFSLGIYFLDARLRNPVYSIYGFVRFADEIVDTFHDYDKKYLLQKFRADTNEAIRDGISLNPILNSFQQVVHQYAIDIDLVDTFLDSMEMDLCDQKYTTVNYDKYILGSAEVVGLMCLHVFTEGNKQLYEELKPFAMKLGAAFQKVNFLRDIQADYFGLKRMYFPNVDPEQFTSVEKKAIEREIENDFRIALEGIKKLPASSKRGVYLAYIYYRSLLKKIKRLPPHEILTKRVRISSSGKLRLMINSLVHYKMKLV